MDIPHGPTWGQPRDRIDILVEFRMTAHSTHEIVDPCERVQKTPQVRTSSVVMTTRRLHGNVRNLTHISDRSTWNFVRFIQCQLINITLVGAARQVGEMYQLVLFLLYGPVMWPTKISKDRLCKLRVRKYRDVIYWQFRRYVQATKLLVTF